MSNIQCDKLAKTCSCFKGFSFLLRPNAFALFRVVSSLQSWSGFGYQLSAGLGHSRYCGCRVGHGGNKDKWVGRGWDQSQWIGYWIHSYNSANYNLSNNPFNLSTIILPLIYIPDWVSQDSYRLMYRGSWSYKYPVDTVIDKWMTPMTCIIRIILTYPFTLISMYIIAVHYTGVVLVILNGVSKLASKAQ